MYVISIILHTNAHAKMSVSNQYLLEEEGENGSHNNLI